MATYKYKPGGYTTGTGSIMVSSNTIFTGTASGATYHLVVPTQIVNTTTTATSGITMDAAKFVNNRFVNNTFVNDRVWHTWRDDAYDTVEVTWQNEIWNRWEHDEATRADLQQRQDELQALREQRSREQLAAEQLRMENRQVAHTRARELLDLVVADEDRVPGLDLLQVVGSDGNLYRIEMHRPTVHGNIVQVDGHGCILGRACVAPSMHGDTGVLPTADGWVGQYLGLKFDAAQFLSHANWSGRRPCRVPSEQAA